MQKQLNPIYRLLFHGAKRSWSDPERETIARIITGKIDWEKWLSLARYFRISPLLYFNFNHNKLLENMPANIRQELKADFLETHSLNLAHYHELSRLLALFQSAGIDCLVLKGAALAVSLYPDIGLRPFGDIDLLLHDKDIASAEKILGQGYSRQTPDNLSALAQSCYFHYHYQRLSAPKLSIELHWRLFSPTMPLNLDLLDFWEGQRIVNSRGQSFPIPRRECLFLHLCLHFCGHYFVSLRDLWDIDWFLSPDEPALDWDKLIDIVRRYRLEYRLYYPLNWAQRLLDIQPPQGIMARLQPPPANLCIMENIMASYGGILREPASRNKDLRAVIDILLLSPKQILTFVCRLCYPGIAWLTVFPDNPREGNRLKIFLRGIRLFVYSLWKLIRACF